MLASDIKKKQKTEADLENAKIIAERNNCLATLVASSKLKNDLMQQQFAYQLFMQTPDAVESQAFFAAMRKKDSSNKYVAVVVDAEVAVVESVESVKSVKYIVDDTDDCEDDDDEDDEVIQEHFNEHFDELGHWVPGGYHKDTVLEEIVAQRGSQPVICIYAMIGSNFSRGTPPPLPSTQNLLAALQSNDFVQDDVEDTQLTTLSM